MSIPTNEEIESELKAIGKPGEKQSDKKEYIKSKYPNLSNPQGIKLYEVLESYRNY